MKRSKRKKRISSPKRLSAGRSVKRFTKRKKRSGMSELFSPSTAIAGAKTIGAGAIGGLLSGIATKMIADQKPLTRYGLQVGASFITYALLGFPSMASGMAGGFVALETAKMMDKNTAMNEDGDMYADPDAINQLPAMMSENGDPITLAQSDEGLVYLNENTGEVTLAENVYLQENAYLQENSIYPSYSTEY
jgi:hypothetical protein